MSVHSFVTVFMIDSGENFVVSHFSVFSLCRIYHEIKMLPCCRVIRKYREDQKTVFSAADYWLGM